MPEKITLNTPKVRAHVITRKADDREESNQIRDGWEDLYEGNDILMPPYNFPTLAQLVKMSNMLPQCIDAMKQNCEGFGYNLVTEVKADDLEGLKDKIGEEKDQLDQFFKYISYDMSFTKMRKLMRGDLETFGNGYLEVLRNGEGLVDGMNYIKGIDMRLGKLSELVEVEVKKQNVEDYDYETVPYKKRFRMYIQKVGEEKVYFKEYGDPRRINAATGNPVSEDEAAEEAEEGSTKVIVNATEVLHFKLEDPETAYGIPRWAGNMASIAGSRAAEEVNFLYFDNKGVPPLAILVSGGTMNDDTVERVEKFINEEMKGRDNFHKILILEAESTPSPNTLEQNRTRIEIKELMNLKEGTFMEYDKNNRQKVRSAFRLPPIYVGLTEDYTRATAKESKEIAEEQVFGPEKQDFDFVINHKIFADLEVKYNRFETKSAPVENRQDQAKIIKDMGEAGLTVGEVRKELDRISDIELDDLGDQKWLQVPMKLAQFILQIDARDTGDGDDDGAGDGDDKSKKSRKGVDSLGDFLKMAMAFREKLKKEIEKEDAA